MPENINTLAVGYEDASCRIWDLRTIGSIGKLKDKGFESVTAMEFSKSGRLLFSAHNTNKIKVWDVLTEKNLGTFGSKEHTGVVRSLSLSEDGMTLLSAGKDGLIHKWQLQQLPK